MHKSFMFYENSFYQEQRQLEENKTIIKSKFYFKKWGMWLVYRDTKLQINRNIIGNALKTIIFVLKTNILKIQGQHKLSTTRVDNLFCNKSFKN